MDPDEALGQLLKLARRNINNDPDKMTSSEMAGAADDAAEMAQLIETLDDWLCNKNYLPTRWQTTKVPPLEVYTLKWWW